MHGSRGGNPRGLGVLLKDLGRNPRWGRMAAASVQGGSAGDDELHGGAGDDLIWGGRGDDTLDSGADDDTLIGGPGADVLIGGPGVDTVDYSSAANRGVNISLGACRTSWPDSAGLPDAGAGDDFSSIENFVGTKFNDWLAGDGGDNQIEGRRGNDWIVVGGAEDTLFGGDGHDHLFGGPGDDVLFGGDGTDRIDGGPGSDTVTYAGAVAGVTVRRGDADVGAGQDTIEAVEVVIGSDGDTLGGDDAAVRTRSRAAGAKTLCTADPGSTG